MTRSEGSRPVIELRHLTKRYGPILAVIGGALHLVLIGAIPVALGAASSPAAMPSSDTVNRWRARATVEGSGR